MKNILLIGLGRFGRHIAMELSELGHEIMAVDGEIMAVEHTEYPIYGVQFHPESVMTPDGKVMVQNFINIVKK